MMDYRRSSMVVDVAAKAKHTRNLNIYAAVGPAPINNGVSLAETMWWDSERIEATITRPFVLTKLQLNEQVRLDQQVGFGDGLTDHTYLEWIQEKSKRIFLILCDLGVPDQIFGVIDDSWDDDDLPIRLENVERLRLTQKRDVRMEQKFFKRQFAYLLRNLQKGDHIEFSDEELVPLDFVDRRSTQAKAPSSVDQVHLPGRPDDVFLRRRIPLGLAGGKMPREEYLAGIDSMKSTEHPHLMSMWASYTHMSTGYVLLQPVCSSNLKAYLLNTPPSIKILAKQDRRVLLMNWLHCLSSALAFLHSKGLSHRKIKPSNVMFDIDNNIFLGDSGIFSHDQTKEVNNEKETYDYASPEQVDCPEPEPNPPLRPPPSPSILSRKLSSVSSIAKSFASDTSVASTITPSSATDYNSNKPCNSSASSKNPTALTIPVLPNSDNHTIDPQKSDIFSLACIFLELLNLLLKRSPKSFVAHRSTISKPPLSRPSSMSSGLPKKPKSLAPDTSFHGNISKVESWSRILGKDASKKEDTLFRGVGHILTLINRMMNPEPTFRPSAKEVESRILDILLKSSKIPSPSIHCGVGGVQMEQSGSSGGGNWDFGFQDLALTTMASGGGGAPSISATAGIISMTAGTGKLRQGSNDREYGSMGPYGGSPNRRQSGTGDTGSIMTKASGSGSKSSEGKSGSGLTGSSSAKEMGKAKPKAKAWEAPVYAEFSFG